MAWNLDWAMERIAQGDQWEYTYNKSKFFHGEFSWLLIIKKLEKALPSPPKTIHKTVVPGCKHMAAPLAIDKKNTAHISPHLRKFVGVGS